MDLNLSAEGGRRRGQLLVDGQQCRQFANVAALRHGRRQDSGVGEQALEVVRLEALGRGRQCRRQRREGALSRRTGLTHRADVAKVRQCWRE